MINIPENQYMPAVRETWAMRCKEESLRMGTNKREAQMLAYMQGVLAVATASGVMEHSRASMIAMLCMVGRGEEFLAIKEEK